MVINASLVAANSCYFFYSRPSNAIQLANDSGTLGNPQTLGTAGTLFNGQCSINVGASSSTISGVSLTVNVVVTLNNAGNDNIYMEAQNTMDSGWAQRGTFTVGNPVAPTLVSVSPSSGSGAVQTFAFTISDTNGASNIQWVQLDVNASLTAASACYFYYVPSSNTIQLAGDSGSFGPSLTIGSPGTQQNSQCIVDAGASSSSISSNTLVLNLALSFKQPAFSGAKNIYMDASGQYIDSGWALKGSWTVP
jgi:hypothetical protein